MQHNANNENKTKLVVTVNNRKREKRKKRNSTTTTVWRTWYQVPDSHRAPKLQQEKPKNVYRDVVVFTTATYKKYFW